MISKIAKYPVEAELGRGGFGVVYRGYDPDVGRPVAIKVLTAETDPDLLKRFQDEVGTTGNLTHRNIVVVFESGNESGVPYLVMEPLSGRTLQELIKNAASIPLLEKVRIMAQVAEGLKYAHQKNVIHRDVKPGNVMLLTDGNVKIMDFGISRVTTRSTVVTREGYLIGTIPYMAPEQFQSGGKADKQTDLFAYGVVYYELLTGKHPFESEDNVYATIERIKLVEPDLVTSLVPECPEALELLIYRAIAKDREVRYANFEELLFDSEAILSDLLHDRAASILQEVPSLIEAGAIESAEDKLKEIAELQPGNRDARQYRKIIQDEKERRRLATRLPALIEESEAHLRARRFSEAVQTLETALRLARNDETVQARLAGAQARLEAYRRANQLVSEARRDQQRGQIADAEQRVRAALEADAEHPDAKVLLARLPPGDSPMQARTNWFDAGLTDTALIVREKLAANAVPEAVEQLKATRTLYANDARWKQLEQEVAERQAYELVLVQADVERQRGDFAKAEELLSGFPHGGLDGRLSGMLAEVQDQRLSHEMAAANKAIGRGDFDRGLALMEALRLRATPEWAPRIEEAYQAAQHKKEQALRDRFRQVRAQVLAGKQKQQDREQAVGALTGQVHALAGRREFVAALDLLTGGLKQFPDAEPLRQLRESLLARARAASLILARSLYQEGKAEAALEAVQLVLRNALDDRELLEVKAQIEAGIERRRLRQL